MKSTLVLSALVILSACAQEGVPTSDLARLEPAPNSLTGQIGDRDFDGPAILEERFLQDEVVLKVKLTSTRQTGFVLFSHPESLRSLAPGLHLFRADTMITTTGMIILVCAGIGDMMDYDQVPRLTDMRVTETDFGTEFDVWTYTSNNIDVPDDQVHTTFTLTPTDFT